MLGPFKLVHVTHAALEESHPHIVNMAGRTEAVGTWFEMREFCEDRYGPDAKVKDTSPGDPGWMIDPTRRWARYGLKFYFLNWHEAVEFKLNWY